MSDQKGRIQTSCDLDCCKDIEVVFSVPFSITESKKNHIGTTAINTANTILLSILLFFAAFHYFNFSFGFFFFVWV